MPISKRYLIRKQKNLQRGWKSLSREEKGDLSRLIKIIGATLLILFFIYNVGISGLAQLSGFWSILAGKSGEIQTDTTAPPPPTFAPTSPYTKSQKANLTGYAEPAAEVKVAVNGIEVGKTITEAGGTFTIADVPLGEGKNVVTASAADRSGNVSQKSAELIINLDRKPPDLTVLKPTNGQKFVGEAQRQIDAEGNSEPGTTVRVNDIQAKMDAEGLFKATLTLAPGDNKITVVATDKAGNEKKVELTVNYAP